MDKDRYFLIPLDAKDSQLLSSMGWLKRRIALISASCLVMISIAVVLSRVGVGCSGATSTHTRVDGRELGSIVSLARASPRRHDVANETPEYGDGMAMTDGDANHPPPDDDVEEAQLAAAIAASLEETESNATHRSTQSMSDHNDTARPSLAELHSRLTVDGHYAEDAMFARAIAESRMEAGLSDFEPDIGMSRVLQPPSRVLQPRGSIDGWSDILQVVSAEAFAEVDGVSQGDKILLPDTVLQELTERMASLEMPRPMIFSLALAGSKQPPRHVGVLEFSAPRGSVVVPLWIMRAMGASDGDSILVQTAALPKGTFAKLQPLNEEFATLQDAKGTLERAITGVFTTLSKGDSISVPVAGHGDIEVFVVDLQPADAVCTIDTELQVDFAQSVINEEEQRRFVAESAKQQLLKAEAAAKAAAELAVNETAAARKQILLALPSELPAGPDVTTIVCRMPDGLQLTRRFANSATLALVRQWVEASSPPERLMRTFDLISNFPRFVASSAKANMTVHAAGLYPSATVFVKELDAVA